MIWGKENTKRWAAAAALALTLLLAAPARAAAADDAVLGVIDVKLTAAGERSARSAESSLADVTADALRRQLGTDIAIVNGGDLKADLPRSSVTREKLGRVFAQDRETATASVTPAQLCAMLEAGVSHIVLAGDESIDHAVSGKYGGFPQVSGFRYLYDASAPAGQRVMEMQLDDGTELDPQDDETRLTLAATAYMLSGGYDYPAVSSAEPSGRTLADALADHVRQLQTVGRPAMGRIRTAGTTEGALMDYLPVSGILVAVVLLGLFSDKKYKKIFSYKRM